MEIDHDVLHPLLVQLVEGMAQHWLQHQRQQRLWNDIGEWPQACT
jgi:hypothetical protein